MNILYIPYGDLLLVVGLYSLFKKKLKGKRNYVQ